MSNVAETKTTAKKHATTNQLKAASGDGDPLDGGPRACIDEAERWLRGALAGIVVARELYSGEGADLETVQHAIAQALAELVALRAFLPEEGGAS